MSVQSIKSNIYSLRPSEKTILYLKNVRDVAMVAMTVLGVSIILKAMGCLSSNYSATWLQMTIDAMSCVEVLGTLLGGTIVLHLAVYFGTKYQDKKMLEQPLEHKDKLGGCAKDSGGPLMLAELLSQLTLGEPDDFEDKVGLFRNSRDRICVAQLKPGEWFVDSKGRLWTFDQKEQTQVTTAIPCATRQDYEALARGQPFQVPGWMTWQIINGELIMFRSPSAPL